MTPLSIPEVPYLTQSISGCGGKIKVEPSDFEVEEIPAYSPSGTGEHIFLWVQKTRLSTEQLLGHIRKTLNLSFDECGSAGLKDSFAVTRQWLSVPARVEPEVHKIENEQIQVLQVTRHGNKLRSGHLRGNRFRILIRGADPTKAPEVSEILQTISAQGLPNFYGAQRFGYDGKTLQLGLELFQGHKLRLSGFLRKLALSSVQSALFNFALAERITDGYFRTVLLGDVMCKWPTGGMFNTTDPAVDQERLNNREIIPAGPIFGTKMFPAKAVAAEREQTLLQRFGLTPRSFSGFGKLLLGTRRMNFVYVDDLKSTWEPHGLRLEFTLPAGSYATVLLAEVMKAPVEEPANESPPPNADQEQTTSPNEMHDRDE